MIFRRDERRADVELDLRVLLERDPARIALVGAPVEERRDVAFARGADLIRAEGSWCPQMSKKFAEGVGLRVTGDSMWMTPSAVWVWSQEKQLPLCDEGAVDGVLARRVAAA